MRLALATLSAFTLLAAPAAADDPLLSGYSGPGGGEQSDLGGTFVGGRGGGNLRAPERAGSGAVTPAAGAPTPAPFTPTPATPKTSPTTPKTSPAGSTAAPRPRRSAEPATGSKGSADAARPATAGPGAAAPSAVDTRSGVSARAVSTVRERDAIGAFPLAGGDVALLVAGLLAVGAVAAATARLRDPRAAT